MKQLIDIITEDKVKYERSEDFVEKTKKAFTELQNLLPAYPNYKGDKFHYGLFKFNEYDLTRYPVESVKYIGSADHLEVTLDTKNNDIDTEILRSAFESTFKTKIEESLFDKDLIKRKTPEYEWVQGIYDGLSEFFKTKDLSKIHFMKTFLGATKASIYKELESLPTIEKDGLIFTLYGIVGFDEKYGLRDNYEWNRLTMYVYVYEKKDEEKIQSIKAQNDARKPLDIVDRELQVGDTVAYALLGGYRGGYKGMKVGDISKVNKDMVEVGGSRVQAKRCCLISRKGGKRIE